MTKKWVIAGRIFSAALDVPESERASFISAASGPDEALAREVLSMFDQDATDDIVLDAPELLGLRLAADDSLLGEVVDGRYRIERELGRGAQSTVYLANDLRVENRPVAVKVFTQGALIGEGCASRELNALSSVLHPGIVAVLDAGETGDGRRFLVMQHVPGETLRQRLTKGTLPIAEAATLIKQLAEALLAAHTAGVVHGDLKPENILLQPIDGRRTAARIVDFGVAHHRKTQNRAGTVMVVGGTEAYMAPEQMLGAPTPASDIWSLALVAWEMITGELPFRTATERRHWKPSAIPAAGPLSLAVFERGLRFDPADRPTTPEFGAAISKTLVDRSRRARAQAQWRRMNRWQQALTALSAAACVFVLSLLCVRTIRRVADELDTSRVIEKTGAYAPIMEGFKLHGELNGTVRFNDTHTGYDAWSVTTGSQGFYYRELSLAQQRLAMRKGWTLTSVVRVDSGEGLTEVEFPDGPTRFTIGALLANNSLSAFLLTSNIPKEGLEVPLRGDPRGWHEYELTWYPMRRAADLSVDGRPAIRDYRGSHQFYEGPWLMFGSVVWKAPVGSASFRSVRFEIAR